MTAEPPRWRARELLAPELAAIVVLGAGLRFTSLPARSFWRDEAVTVELIRRSFGEMLTTIPDREGTPPLYYTLAWGWTQLFGSSEAGLRSFSALVGTATVVVVYAIGRELVSRRVAATGALLAAVSPLLVWQAQDGRSYALYTFLGALSFLAFVRTLRSPSTAVLTFWAVSSSLALCTHYFAVFLVAPEAMLLLVATCGRDPRTVAAVAGVGIVGLALLPLALAQSSSASVAWIAEISRADRLSELGREFLVGPQAPRHALLTAITAACLLAAAWLLATRGDGRERRAAFLAGGTAIATLVLALAVSLAGVDTSSRATWWWRGFRSLSRSP